VIQKLTVTLLFYFIKKSNMEDNEMKKMIHDESLSQAVHDITNYNPDKIGVVSDVVQTTSSSR
jgi:hypothetical protein